MAEKDIIYGVEKVFIQPIISSTQLVDTEENVIEIDTAETIELEAAISEGDEEIKRTSKKILAVVKTDDLPYGYDVTLTDNTFSVPVAAIIQGAIPKTVNNTVVKGVYSYTINTALASGDTITFEETTWNYGTDILTTTAAEQAAEIVALINAGSFDFTAAVDTTTTTKIVLTQKVATTGDTPNMTKGGTGSGEVSTMTTVTTAATGDSTKNEIVGYSMPMTTQGNMSKLFRLWVYAANREGDSIKDYALFKFYKCQGKPANITIGNEFFTPEFELKCREATRAGKPFLDVTHVDTVPTTLTSLADTDEN